MFTHSLNELRKRSESQRNLQDIYTKSDSELRRVLTWSTLYFASFFINISKLNSIIYNNICCCINKFFCKKKGQEYECHSSLYTTHQGRKASETTSQVRLLSRALEEGIAIQKQKERLDCNGAHAPRNSKKEAVALAFLTHWKNYALYDFNFFHKEKIFWLSFIRKSIIFPGDIFLISFWKSSLKKSQSHLLTNVTKRNMFVSNDTFNKPRKKSKIEQSLRASCRWSLHKSCCRNAGGAIFYLPSSSLQIFTRSSAGWVSRAYRRINHTYDHQNSQRCCSAAPDLCTGQQFDHRRDYKLCRINLPFQRRLSWLISPNKIARFVWSLFLIVTWEQDLSRPIMFLFLIKVAYAENLAH